MSAWIGEKVSLTASSSVSFFVVQQKRHFARSLFPVGRKVRAAELLPKIGGEDNATIINERDLFANHKKSDIIHSEWSCRRHLSTQTRLPLPNTCLRGGDRIEGKVVAVV